MKYIFFKSATCVPCKILTPLVEDIKTKNPIEIETIFIDNDEGMAKARSMFVMSVPTIVKFDGNKEIGRSHGSKTRLELEQFLLS